ncbi:FecR family protein [Chitinophaga japonensis]|uniref:FecR family protein n=1 Tax=Chitinophaga japonensis TaxID=104662 RepID=A0A562TCG7_CHIJA|nr:FecR domain-containing protein [Chitinophaga japonensis]TWI90944.1 FecR family protein [Chitinophaga japonensis]
MDINGFEKVIQRYLNGQATDEDLALVEQWFRQTESNDYQLTEERRRIIAAKLLPRLQAITRPEAAAPPTGRGLLRSLSGRFVRVAAALIIVATTGALGWVFRYQLADNIAPVARRIVKAGPYEIKRVQLPDQTLVILNTGASISYPVAYRGGQRSVNLEGSAFFEVAKDGEKPFIVHTASLDITVLGTSFVVNEQPAQATVSVVTGRVRVAADEQPLAELKPGLQVLYNKQSRKASLQPVDAQQVMAWTQHSLSFTEAPLEQVLKVIAQKWNVALELPAGPSGKQFSGDFTNNDSLDDMMTALALTTGIHWERTATGVITVAYP